LLCAVDRSGVVDENCHDVAKQLKSFNVLAFVMWIVLMNAELARGTEWRRRLLEGPLERLSNMQRTQSYTLATAPRNWAQGVRYVLEYSAADSPRSWNLILGIGSKSVFSLEPSVAFLICTVPFVLSGCLQWIIQCSHTI